MPIKAANCRRKKSCKGLEKRREKTRPDTWPPVADRLAGAEMRDSPLFDSIITNRRTDGRTYATKKDDDTKGIVLLRLVVCGNVAGLAQWTIAMRDFYFVNVIVLTLINSQKRMEAKHTKVKNELNDAEAKLEEVMHRSLWDSCQSN